MITPGYTKFVVKGFLTAMRQEVTRAHKGWALDMVALHNDVTKFTYEEIKAPPPVRCYFNYISKPFRTLPFGKLACFRT